MLTYTPPHEQDLPSATERPWLLLLLCLVWLIPGLFGREPLKPDETVIADIVRHLLDGAPLTTPLLAGEAWVERAPLFYWLAAACAWLGQCLGLAIHDGARLATGLFTALALWGTGMSGRALIGRRHGRSAVLILLGSVGLLLPGHMLSADTAVLAGWAWGLFALIRAPRAPLHAGALLGLCLALCGLAGSLADAGLLLLLALSLLLFKHWRQSRFSTSLVIASSLGVPLVAAWPLALSHADPQAFQQWWDWHALGFLGGFAAPGAFHPFGFYLKLLPWFAWPGWFLAGATLWMQKDRLAQPRFQLPLMAVAITLFFLLISRQEKPGYALLLLPPLALIGAVGLDVLRRGASAFVNWLGVMSFGLLIASLWAAWSALHLGVPAKLAGRAMALAPGFVPHFSLTGLLFGLGLTIAWLWAVSRRRPVGRQAVTNWAAGMAACWGLAMAFATEWVDTRNAYQQLASQMAPMLPKSGCVASEALYPSQRAVFHYYLGLKTVRQRPESAECEWLLRQADSEPLSPPSGWQQVWHGSRAGDRNEQYYLYRKDGHD
ncbi:ArnT family glycosyltransferase [Chitinimonas sp.]|uniref:ArnT family glycosyltransferase n=1 Tax=Chitinimonas sp. TaxID=1934313 RepID=UPI0035B0B292